MAFFTMAALAFSSYNLYALHNATRRIATNDLPVINSLIKLRTSLLAQESYAGKYAILKDPTFIGLFRKRETETLANLTMLERLDGTSDVASLKRLYGNYLSAANRLFSGATADAGQLRPVALNLLNVLDAHYDNRQQMLQDALQQTTYQRASSIRWSILISCLGFLFAIAVAPFITYRTFRAIRDLQRATHRIAEGDFDYVPQVPDGDEISELAKDFTHMAARLKVLEQESLDASPLTRLPGNLVIERVLNDRLKGGTTFAFCYADLDNFKPFSDHYGYAKGSELLRVTGDLIYDTVKTHGNQDCFVGHVGGDDFVMVLPIDLAASICEFVLKRFDVEVVKHFNAEDRERGGIEGYDRYGVHRFFPITSISIAVIICGGEEFASAVEIARAAAQVKDAVKETPGSSYQISRRVQVT
jgi:GGDEF domain-containing protein